MTKHPTPRPENPLKRVHLRLLATSDLHMHIMAHDYYSDESVSHYGLSRTATLIDAMRAETPNCLLLDNGDILQGNPLGDLMSRPDSMPAGQLHPMIRTMNSLRYDAATLGNHDFDFGVPTLQRALEGADFPFVSANVLLKPDAEGTQSELMLPASTILHRQLQDADGKLHDLKIGIVGVLPPQVMNWSRQVLDGRVWVQDILPAARSQVSALKTQGADIIIALAHSGIGDADAYDGMENAVVPIAGLDGIDAIVAGHTHFVFPSETSAIPATDFVCPSTGKIHGKPVVQPGFWGSHLGVIDLMLEAGHTGWSVGKSTVRALPVEPDRGVAPSIMRGVSDEHEETRRALSQVLSTSRTPLHTYFALLGYDPAVQLLQNASRQFTAQHLIETEHANLPILAAGAPFRSGGRGGPANYTDVPAGEIALRHVADLYVFPNTLSVVRVTGAELREWLERSAVIFSQVAPGTRDANVLAPNAMPYDFDAIDGVSYQIDLESPPRYGPDGSLQDPSAWRVRNLRLGGRKVTDKMTFAVASNNYRVDTNTFPGARRDNVIFESSQGLRSILQHYVEGKKTLALPQRLNWSFVPQPGTSLLFDTGPGARAYPQDQNLLGLEEVGPVDAGFLRYRMRL